MYLVHAALPALLCAGLVSRAYQLPYVVTPGGHLHSAPTPASLRSATSSRLESLTLTLSLSLTLTLALSLTLTLALSLTLTLALSLTLTLAQRA